MNESTKISIITVVYNSVNNIEMTIRSVLLQNYKNYEYIIIDGGSTDGTLEVINKYREFLAVFISERDYGIYDAMNKGLHFCTGKIIGIINSGDRYLPDTLNRVVSASLLSNADIFYSDMQLSIGDNKTSLIKSNHRNLFWDMTINHPTCFVRSSVYSIRHFDTSFKIAADYDFFVKCTLEGKIFYKINGLLAEMGITGASSNVDLSLFERFRIHDRYYGYIYAKMRIIISIILIKIKSKLNNLMY